MYPKHVIDILTSLCITLIIIIIYIIYMCFGNQLERANFHFSCEHKNFEVITRIIKNIYLGTYTIMSELFNVPTYT